jgi:hypothetical protein
LLEIIRCYFNFILSELLDLRDSSTVLEELECALGDLVDLAEPVMTLMELVKNEGLSNTIRVELTSLNADFEHNPPTKSSGSLTSQEQGFERQRAKSSVDDHSKSSTSIDPAKDSTRNLLLSPVKLPYHGKDDISMADPISIASGLLALVEFALQSSTTLCQAVQSFLSNQRTIRELREELKALEKVLTFLHEAAINPDADLTALKLPLLRCGEACKDFEAIIIKSTEFPGGLKKSLRDWAKLTYMGDDINGFKNMLAGYKSTIAIALGNTNM